MPTTGLDALANKTKQVNDGAARLASTYQLLEEKQSALAKTARYKLSEQPISFVGPQPKGPPVFRLAEDRLPKPKWSTERETYPVAGETRPASPVPPRTPRVRPSTEPKPREEEGEDTEKRLGRGLRGLLAKMPTSSANAVSSVAIAAMITQAVGHGMSYVASLHDIYSNQSLSSGERTKRITETVPLVGSLAKGMHDLIDSFSGLNERVRQASYSYELFARHQAITANTRREQEPLSTRLVEMSAEATNAARFQPEYTAPQAGNQYQLQQYQRNVPITRQLYGAQAEKETAGSLVADAKRREQDAREKARVGAAQIATYKGIFDKQNAEGATEKELRPTRLGIAAGYIKQIEAAEEAKRAVSDRAKATESMAKASSSARQAEIGFKRNELADVDERESKLRGRYQTFGGMQAGTRSMALQAARQAKALGYESLGEYQKGLIKSVAPDYAKEREEEIGKKYGADEFARLIPSKNEDQRTLGELQQKQVELNQEIQIKIDLDPALLRKDIADQVGNAIRDLQIQLGKIEQIRKDEAANAKAMEAAGNT